MRYANIDVLISLFILLIFGIIYYIYKFAFAKIYNHAGIASKPILHTISKLIQIAILAIGIIAILGSLHVDISGLIASIGVIGFLISFTLKEFLTNLVSGIAILISQPFKINQVIYGDNFAGEVKDINLRYTILMNTENHDTILVPNSIILNNIIKIKKNNTQKI